MFNHKLKARIEELENRVHGLHTLLDDGNRLFGLIWNDLVYSIPVETVNKVEDALGVHEDFGRYMSAPENNTLDKIDIGCRECAA